MDKFENIYLQSSILRDILVLKFSEARNPEYFDNFNCIQSNIEWLNDPGFIDSDGIILVDKKDDAIMGYSFVTSSKKIFSVFVFPEYRRLGLGKFLIKKSISELNGKWLEVEKTNKKAISLYNSLGFSIIDEGTCFGEEDSSKKVPCYIMSIN